MLLLTNWRRKGWKRDRRVWPGKLGTRNERGEKLVEFCKRNKFVVTNTRFKKQKRRRYTWTRPGDTGRFQLDYILVRDRYRNSVKDSCSYPGADADSDHNLVAMTVRIKFKKIVRQKGRKNVIGLS